MDSVSRLPVDGEIIRRLGLLGLHTVAQVAELTQDQLALQFGEEGKRLWRLLRGLEVEAAPQEEEEEPFRVSAPMEEGIAAVLRPLFEMLGKKLCFEMQCLFDGQELVVSFSRGTSDWEKAHQMLLQRMVGKQLGEPKTFTVEITRAFEPAPRQLSLLEKERDLSPITRRFSRQPDALMQVVWDDRHHRLPERRAHLRSLIDETRSRGLCEPQKTEKPRGSVIDAWRVEEEWWTERPIRRTYYQMRLPSGAVHRYFRDGKQWFRQ